MSRRWRFPATIVIAATLISTAAPIAASDDLTSRFEVGAVSPTSWPRPFDQGPSLEGWPNALRIWGPDRYQTSLATALTMRGLGGFPFDRPDPSGTATVLGQPGSWWGLQTCPRSVIVVAGDSPADALAATALSDPTDESTEPYLRRSAAADPLFDPIGGYNRVDTQTAAILLTKSTRDGAYQLSTAAQIAAKDLRSGGCSTARQAIIVGGSAAVPAGVDEELVALGFSEVFRVQGLNRYQTAAKVAIALGTAGVPEEQMACRDMGALGRSPDISFYANSVVEWRGSDISCQLLGNTAVLTDGIVGADALAAGWWTSFWQVPVLLHNGRDYLPAATRQALQTLGIENLIVLGGNSRISDAIAQEASELAGARLWRIAGEDRYSTSIEMAKFLGGWWPTDQTATAAGSVVCIAATDPSGRRALGWPDALSAGPWCGAASRSARDLRAPKRAIHPINGPWPAVTSTNHVGRDTAPIILVPSGAKNLPTVTAQFLRDVYPPGDGWCSTQSAISGCAQPGFAVVFGGRSAITNELINEISSIVVGLAAPVEAVSPPAIPQTFATKLSMSPVYQEMGAGDVSLCVRRGALRDTRWLAAGTGQSQQVDWHADLLTNGWYLVDADGIRRSTDLSTNGCVLVDSGHGNSHWVRAVNSYGRASSETRFRVSPERWTFLDGGIEAKSSMIFSGIDSAVDPASGGETSLQMKSDGSFRQITRNGETASIVATTLSLVLRRGVDNANVAPDRFDANWSINTHLGSLKGTATGEAIFKDGIWSLRGVTSLNSGTWPGENGRGGFRADLSVGRSGNDDDTSIWLIDGLLTR